MNSCTLIRSLVPALACAAGLLAATAVAADAVPLTRTLTVRYGDVDLSTIAGAGALYQRIEGAARFVCGEQGGGLDERNEWLRCYHDAVGVAVARVNDPLLTAIHRERLGEGPQTAMLGR